MILKFKDWDEFKEILAVGVWMNQVTGNLNLGNDLIEFLEQYKLKEVKANGYKTKFRSTINHPRGQI